MRCTGWLSMPSCEFHDLGRIDYPEALRVQNSMVEKRKQNLIPDQLLIVEHPHVITLGRNGRLENLLAGPDVLRRAGIAFHDTDRGGDITYHGPGQVVIDVLARFGIAAGRIMGATGVWVDGKKVAAIGVHISRWVTSHGFALNVNTDLSYFQYIVPCGLSMPVTSMAELGCNASRDEVVSAVACSFSQVFNREMEMAA